MNSAKCEEVRLLCLPTWFGGLDNNSYFLQVKSTERNVHVVKGVDDFINQFHDGILNK